MKKPLRNQGSAKITGLFFIEVQMKTAILVDGGYYKRRAWHYAGEKTPLERANELESYCRKHLRNRDSYTVDEKKQKHYLYSDLYRIFYYDCEPVTKNVYHPFLKRNIDFSKQPTFKWMNDFLDCLKEKRKFALRLGFLSADEASYTLNNAILKKLFREEITLDDITEKDFEVSIRQKGVDMKIGLDIASLAYKKQVDQIVLIAGDSDFVPAAKLARREGIDFILDPMGNKINSNLFEHIDGLRSNYKGLKKEECGKPQE